MNNEWYTPAALVDAARQVLGEIDLDVASSAKANEAVGAKNFYTVADDGKQAKKNPRTGSAVFYFGRDKEKFFEIFGSLGLCAKFLQGRIQND